MPSSPDRSIDDFIARYVKLTKEKDSQGLAAMYTDPAEWTDVTGTRSLTRAEIKDLFDATYSIVSTVYDSQAKDVTITVSGSSAVVQFTWMQDVHNTVLGQRVKTEGSMTWSLERVGGKWYITEAKVRPSGAGGRGFRSRLSEWG